MMEDVDVQNTTGCEIVGEPKISMFGFSLGGFETLVETFIIDLIVLFVVFCLFSLLTKISRKEDLSHGHKKNWIQLFYGDKNNASSGSDETDVVSTSKLGNPKGCMFWLLAMLRLSDEDIYTRSGLDSIHYLNFQKNVLLLVGTISVINLLLIVPVNYIGEIEPTRKSFARISLRNVDPQSNIAWVHPFVCYAYFMVSLILLRKFCEVAVGKGENDITNTLLVKKIPLNQRHTAFIKNYFQSSYPDVTIEEVQLAYNVKELVNFNKEWILLDSALKWCEENITSTGERPFIKAKSCGYVCNVCCKCCHAHRVDAMTYYGDRKASLLAKMIKEKDYAFENPLNMAFVTFQTPEMTNNVLKQEHEAGSDGNEEFVHPWKLSLSPSSGNIMWEHLGVKKSYWYLMLFVSNGFLFILIIFFSTPNVVLNLSGVMKLFEGLHITNSFISQYLPTLILIALSSCLPVFVSMSVYMLPYFTRSEYSLAVNIRLFIFLLLMVVILPVTEFTSVEAIFLQAVKKGKYRWECIFIPDNGMFFSTFLIQSGLLGVLMQLIRLPELLIYFLYLLCSHSEAEILAVRKAAILEFDFGVEYAYYLLQLSIIIMFCVAAPIVAPLGLLYLINKYLVDRYNIYFAYTATKVNKSVHERAVVLLVFCFFLLMLFMSVIAFLRNATGFDGIFVLYVFGCFLTLSVLLTKVYKPSFLKYICERKSWTDDTAESSLVEISYIPQEFLPEVMKTTYF